MQEADKLLVIILKGKRMVFTNPWITPDWPAPRQIRSCATTRLGGVSQASYSTFNLGDHVGDDPQAVSHNRNLLRQTLAYQQAAWLKQVHSTIVVKADANSLLEADASWTNEQGVACVVMTADCLPVLFCDKKGQYVAAAHAGWRGLLNGILEATIKALPVASSDLMAWLGPAIGPAAFEVGGEVLEAFVAQDVIAKQAFRASAKQGHYLADLYTLASQRLMANGVTAIYGGGFCTLTDEQRFYSYRRQPQTGRMASLIWLDGQ